MWKRVVDQFVDVSCPQHQEENINLPRRFSPTSRWYRRCSFSDRTVMAWVAPLPKGGQRFQSGPFNGDPDRIFDLDLQLGHLPCCFSEFQRCRAETDLEYCKFERSEQRHAVSLMGSVWCRHGGMTNTAVKPVKTTLWNVTCVDNEVLWKGYDETCHVVRCAHHATHSALTTRIVAHTTLPHLVGVTWELQRYPLARTSFRHYGKQST